MRVVLLDAALGDAVMEPVTTNFAKNSGDDWCEVEESDLFRPEVLEGSRKIARVVLMPTTQANVRQ